MVIQGAALGLAPRDVLRMTLRELDMYAAGFGIAQREKYRQAISVAHLTATLTRVKKMPALKTLLPREPYKETAKERGERVRSMIQLLARSGEVTTTKRRKKNV